MKKYTNQRRISPLQRSNHSQFHRTNIKFQDFDSDNEGEDIYQNTLRSSLMALSNTNNLTDDKKEKPTESRIKFVQDILEGIELVPMVDFDNCNTETATNTRLNKKIMDIQKLFSSINVELHYLKSGTTGHAFKAVSKIDPSIAFAVKVCAYSKDNYGGMNNAKRPENAELLMLKFLSKYVIQRTTPHFVLPIVTFNTSIGNFIKIPSQIIDLNDEKNRMYRNFIERYQKGEFEDFVSVLACEWCNGGDLLEYIRNNYKNMNRRTWVVIIFQILYTLARVHQDYPQFRHNDMKANNILVAITDLDEDRQECYCYLIGNTKFIIPNINIQIKIWDFDFACVGNVIENNKVNSDWTNKIGISQKENKYYDMHYFFNTLISKRFFSRFYDEGVIPDEIKEFIDRIIPEHYRDNEKYVNKKRRIQTDHEYTTPYKVIMKDKLFEKYRYTDNIF